MKKLLPLLLLWCIYINLQAQTNAEFIANVSYTDFVNDVWGYVADDGTEYALVGTSEGVSVVSLADAANPEKVAFAQGSSSTWRDVKTWGQHAYVTTEGTDGLMVIDLSMLPDTISHYNWHPTLEGDVDSLTSCHNLYIDENGYCYLSGSTLNNGGLIIVDVFSEPGQPKIVGIGANIYSHDVYVRDNKAYSSEVNTGELAIYDVADKTNVQLLATQPTPFRVAHNAWLSDDGNTVFTTDETGDAPTAAYDISDLQDIKEVNQFVPLATKGQGVIPHNVHVLNDYLVLSHYGDGLVIVDAHRPENLVEVGNFDTSPEGVGGFVGAWGAYPFLPSGLILVSDSENGLFVIRPDYKRAAYLEGVIKDSTTNEVLSDVTISINDSPISASSSLMGTYALGTVEAGTYEVTISKLGYTSQMTSVTVRTGEVTQLDVTLEEAPSFAFSGQVLSNDESGSPLGAVTVKLLSGLFEFETITDETGNFTLDKVFEGTYDIIAGKWGFKSQLLESISLDEASNTITVDLEQGIEDPFVLDLGWTVTNEEVPFGGVFEWGIPVSPQELALIPNDIVGDVGESCYITGNTTDFQESFFILGKTTLTSPEFDVTDMMVPTLTYFTNFFNITQQQNSNIIAQGTDTLYVYVDNGTEKVLIEKITSDFDPATFAFSQWRSSTITVSDFISPTATMQISFELPSDDFDQIAKAGVDYFRVLDAQIVSNKDIYQNHLTFAAFPNPFTQQLTIEYDQSEWTERPAIVVSDALGRIVLQQELPSNNTIAMPTSMTEGLYFIHLRDATKGSKVLKLMKLEKR